MRDSSDTITWLFPPAAHAPTKLSRHHPQQLPRTGTDPEDLEPTGEAEQAFCIKMGRDIPFCLAIILSTNHNLIQSYPDGVD